MKRMNMWIAAVLSISLLAACDSMPWSNKDDDKQAKKMSNKSAKNAVANIMPAGAASTQPAFGKTTGTVTFTQKGNNVKVVADLKGMPPGMHGIHIHEKGDISSGDLNSAGAHYDPDKHLHGGPTTSPVHAGDLGNIEAAADGSAHMELTVDNISIGGRNDILGKSVIIHAKADDYSTQPSGNSGARIAGGVIQMK